MVVVVIVIFIGMTFAEEYFEYFERPLQDEIYVKIPNDFDTSIHEAVKNGFLDKVQKLIAHGHDVNARNVNQETPLHIVAASKDRLAFAEILLQSGADVNARRDTQEMPIHLSAKLGNVEIVKFLIESGADINAVDIWGTTPLCYAEMYDYPEIVNLLRAEKGQSGLIWNCMEVTKDSSTLIK